MLELTGVIFHLFLEIEPKDGVHSRPFSAAQLFSDCSMSPAQPSMVNPERKPTLESSENTIRAPTPSESLKEEFIPPRHISTPVDVKGEVDDDLCVNDWVDDLLKLPASVDEIFHSKKGRPILLVDLSLFM